MNTLTSRPTTYNVTVSTFCTWEPAEMPEGDVPGIFALLSQVYSPSSPSQSADSPALLSPVGAVLWGRLVGYQIQESEMIAYLFP